MDEDADDDIIFIKEQPIQFSSPLILPSSSSINNNNNIVTSNNPGCGTAVTSNSTYITTPKKFKKQRTISLPQLPLSKLSYQSNYFNVPDQTNAIVPRVTQTENELLHLTGSCAKTLEGNKAVNLTIAHSTSPFYNPPAQIASCLNPTSRNKLVLHYGNLHQTALQKAHHPINQISKRTKTVTTFTRKTTYLAVAAALL